MSDASKNQTARTRDEEEAIAWLLRRERGFTPSEQDAFCQWLADDPRHASLLARFRKHWHRLDRLVDWRPENDTRPNPDLLAPWSPATKAGRNLRRFWTVALPLLAAAAVVAFLIFVQNPTPPAGQPAPSPTAQAPSPIKQLILADGSVIDMNRGAVVSVQYAADERRVNLEQGEAHFTVAKNPNRPFVVTAHGVAVRAVGTAFDVRLSSSSVEVLVTEGKVQVRTLASADAGFPSPKDVPYIEAGQRTVVALHPSAPAPLVVPVTDEETDRILAWKPRLLDFTSAPLSEIVAEFNRHNSVQFRVDDPTLRSLRISASFRSDNLDGFVRLLDASLGVKVQRVNENELLLSKEP